VLAFSPGPGFDAVFESLGVSTQRLADVEKPSAGEIAQAANALARAAVIVLPNHPNVVMAARLAAEAARCQVTVVPTRSAPEGIAAALTFSSDEPVSANAPRMEAAASAVTTVEVTTAAADRVADGVEARAGEAIALLNGRLVVSTPGLVGALVAALERAYPPPDGLITIYTGELPPGVGAAAVAEAVQRALPGRTVEVVAGGQVLYPLIASIEA
jgi:dihydroxyacetone kinase-like predicted kinase